jgi:polyvinyl alcohol dehydrogenase (cytochrome)
VCCTNHGYVLSLDPKDGSQQWRYDTMPDAAPVRDRGDGKMLFGPSGAPIWNSPAIDETRGLIYVGTGESNSPPVSKNTDAMIAIGLADGKQRWSRQGTDKDVFLSGCGPHPKPTQLNCASDTVYPDVDFGASMIITPVGGGGDMMFAGQKSGAVWALDPVSGKLLWRNPLGTGSPLGGVHWGIAFAHDTVYAPISFVGGKRPDEAVDPDSIQSGVYALDARTGAVKWVFATKPDCAGDRITRMPSCRQMFGMSTAPTVIDGALVEGGLDGWLYVLDARTGALLWKFDTAIPYQGVNGVAGKGGAIDAASITAGDGLLLVNSGYGLFGEAPGNVFLAFKPKS